MPTKHKERVATHYEEEGAKPAAPHVGEKAVESTIDNEAVDKLLDEIDGVLEENAELTVTQFRQQNGQ